MLPNVTVASAALLSSLNDRTPRNRIVMIEGAFPLIHYVHDWLATRLGAEIAVVPSSAGDRIAADEGRIIDAIGEKTAVVASGSWRRWFKKPSLVT